MPQYLIRLTPARVEMLTEGLTPAEEALVERHSEILEQLAIQGTLILYGRTQNNDERTFGIVVLETADETAAEAIIKNDPAVQGGVMKAELFPYKVVFARAV